MEQKNYTYMLKCRDNSLYTGWTNNIEKRITNHNLDKGAKYTKGRTPCSLIYLEIFETKSQALKREAAIKKLPREEKIKLITQCPLKDMIEEINIRVIQALQTQKSTSG